MRYEDKEMIFIKILGILSIINELNSYEKYHKEYHDIFKHISSWLDKFYQTKKLSFITREELLEIYHKINDVEFEALFDRKIGIESQLSNELSIWYWELMELRKKEIEDGR